MLVCDTEQGIVDDVSLPKREAAKKMASFYKFASYTRYMLSNNGHTTTPYLTYTRTLLPLFFHLSTDLFALTPNRTPSSKPVEPGLTYVHIGRISLLSSSGRAFKAHLDLKSAARDVKSGPAIICHEVG